MKKRRDWSWKAGEKLIPEPSKFEIWMETEGKAIKGEIKKSNKGCFICGINDRTKLTKHHVFPRCLGGLDTKDNNVRLCVKDHERIHDVGRAKSINEKYMLMRLIQLRDRTKDL